MGGQGEGQSGGREEKSQHRPNPQALESLLVPPDQFCRGQVRGRRRLRPPAAFPVGLRLLLLVGAGDVALSPQDLFGVLGALLLKHVLSILVRFAHQAV